MRFFLASNSWVYLSRVKSHSKAAAMSRCNQLSPFHNCRLLGKRESATLPTQECPPAWVVPSQCYSLLFLLFLLFFDSYAFIFCVCMVTNSSSFKTSLSKGVCVIYLDGRRDASCPSSFNTHNPVLVATYICSYVFRAMGL